MKRYNVILLKNPNIHWNLYPAGFFPRAFHYKADAKKLVKQVASWGGLAMVIPVKEKVNPGVKI